MRPLRKGALQTRGERPVSRGGDEEEAVFQVLQRV